MHNLVFNLFTSITIIVSLISTNLKCANIVCIPGQKSLLVNQMTLYIWVSSSVLSFWQYLNKCFLNMIWSGWSKRHDSWMPVPLRHDEIELSSWSTSHEGVLVIVKRDWEMLKIFSTFNSWTKAQEKTSGSCEVLKNSRFSSLKCVISYAIYHCYQLNDRGKFWELVNNSENIFHK